MRFFIRFFTNAPTIKQTPKIPEAPFLNGLQVFALFAKGAAWRDVWVLLAGGFTMQKRIGSAS